ncbi:MAG: helix-turn-helix transcriptional regulator [Candidatus Taylorbacteria bacterium]
MRSKIVHRIMDETPAEVKIFIDKYADLVLRINQILREKKYTQKLLAEKLEKSPSEIHKWLNGEHNFTLRSIARLEAELGETLLEVPAKKRITEVYSGYSKTTYTMTCYRNVAPLKEKAEDWKNAAPQTKYKNVG